MIFKKMTMDPYVLPEKRFYIEIWDKKIGEKPKIIGKKYFSTLKEALEYFDEVQGD